MGFSAKIRDFMGYPEDDYEDPGERSEADSPEDCRIEFRVCAPGNSPEAD